MVIYLFILSFNGNLSDNTGSLKSVFGIMNVRGIVVDPRQPLAFFYSPKCPDQLSGSSSFLLYG